jgi:hypothetical protein
MPIWFTNFWCSSKNFVVISARHSLRAVEVKFSGTVLGRQANLKETSEGKELVELRLQVLVVVVTSDVCEFKKEIMRLKSDLQSEDRGACY